jgi:tetratricopeptide (TPR) repeat protein
MGFRVHLFMIVCVLMGCASSGPRGRIVPLQTSFIEEQAAVATNSPLGGTSTQDRVGDSTVPQTPEEAAIFHFSMGQAFSLDNDHARAIESYRAALIHDPKSALLRSRLAAELVKMGAYSEAKLLCEEAVKLDPKLVDSYLLLAGIQVAAKEFSEAIATYRKALIQEPNNRDALLYYGVTLAESGQVAEGIKQLERLVALKENSESNIDHSVAHFYLGKIQEEAGRLADAERSYRGALKKRASFGKAAIALADLLVGQKRNGEAEKVLLDAFSEGHSSELAERLADLFLERNQFQEAIPFLETLVDEDPANDNIRLRLGLVYWQIQWLDKAERVFKELQGKYPNSSELAFYLGELNFERKDFAEARVHYQKVASDYQKFDQVVSRMVFMERQEGRWQAADSFLRKSLEQRGDLVALYTLLAALHEDQGNLALAKDALSRGRMAFPKDENLLYYLGFLQDRMGQRDAALATMEALLQQNPMNVNALNFIGYSLLEKGSNLQRAEVLLSQAYQLRPEDPFIIDSYAWLLHRQGKSREAMKLLEKAHMAKPQEAVIAEHLADVYYSLSMPNKALAIYRKAIEAVENDGEVTARLQQKIRVVEQLLASRDSSPVRQPAESSRPRP